MGLNRSRLLGQPCGDDFNIALIDLPDGCQGARGVISNRPAWNELPSI
jgi:hypothetical protein